MAVTKKQQRQLYLVPVSAQVARARAKRFAFQGTDGTPLLRAADDVSRDALTRLQKQTKAERINLWAVRSGAHLQGTWSRIQPGDWFLFYARGRIFGSARVFDICESRSIATALWGHEDGSAFSLLVLFDQVEQLSLPAWDYRSVLGGRFIGFRRLSDEFRTTLIRRFGSVDDFVQIELPKASAKDSEEPTPAD